MPGLNPAATGSSAPERALGLNNTVAYLVPATYKQVVDHDESGWWAPGQKRRSDSGGRGSVSVSGKPSVGKKSARKKRNSSVEGESSRDAGRISG